MSRVLITTGIFPPDIGGPATYVPKFATHLLNLGEHVKVITFSSGNFSDKSNYTFPIIRLERTISKPIRTLVAIREIASSLRRSDLLFCNGLIIETAVAVWITRFQGNSLIKVVGDPVWERLENAEGAKGKPNNLIANSRRKVKSIIERRIVVWSLRQFSHITCPGEALAGTVRSWDKNLQVQVIANGVDVTIRTYSVEKRFDLISISRLVPWKNVDQLIDIAKDLNCSLAIIGDGPSLVKLEMLAKGYEKIVFLGKREPHQLEQLLRESKVFCQISEYEGLSFSLLQAMAQAMPCVVSDIPANRDVFGTNSTAAIFFTQSNRDSVLEEIKGLLNSDKRRALLGNQSRAIVEKVFDEKKKLQEMYELLASHE